MDQINLWLNANMQNQFWRVAVIIGLAVVTALLLRILVLPLFFRLSRKTSSNIDDKVFEYLWPAVMRTVLLQGVHIATLDFVQVKRIDTVVSSLTATLMILIWGRFLNGVGSIIFKKLSMNAERYKWIQPQTLPLI